MVLLSLAALLAGFGVFYHFVVTTPRRERAALELERQRFAERQVRQIEYLRQGELEQQFAKGLLLQLCLQEAAAANLNDWSKTCTLQSLPADCTLPAPLADTLGEAARQRRVECFAKYPPPR
jgi:hypothetical protein